MIRLEHVSKTFDSKAGNVHAVQDVTLTIQDKEIYGIIGFSGAGKSTLVRCINLLERPSRGAVVIDDQDITKMKDKELRAYPDSGPQPSSLRKAAEASITISSYSQKILIYANLYELPV